MVDKNALRETLKVWLQELQIAYEKWVVSNDLKILEHEITERSFKKSIIRHLNILQLSVVGSVDGADSELTIIYYVYVRKKILGFA